MKIVQRTIFPELKKALSDPRAVVITGTRRVGKTTTLRWLVDQVASENKLFMDLERLDQRTIFQEPKADTQPRALTISCGAARYSNLDGCNEIWIELSQTFDFLICSFYNI